MSTAVYCSNINDSSGTDGSRATSNAPMETPPEIKFLIHILPGPSRSDKHCCQGTFHSALLQSIELKGNVDFFLC